MPQSVPQFKLFISCPGDVDKERKRIVDFLKNSEAGLDRRRKPAMLVPLFWKNIVAPFDRVRPQSVINVNFNDYDFYIGILGLRFGTPTMDENGNAFGSGTEEEFTIAVQKKDEGADIEMYMFFKRVRTPSDAAKKEDYDKVVAFKRRIQPSGWVNSYKNPVDLTDQLDREMIPLIEEKIEAFNKGLKDMFLAKVAAPPEVGPAIALAVLTEDFPEVERPIPRTVSLEDPDPIANLFFGDWDKKALTQLVLEEKRLVVLGNAGSGKSTELGKLVDHYLDPGTSLIPVFKRLNQYQGEAMEDFLPVEFQSLPEPVALVVLDGLDEVEPEFFKDAVRQINLFSEQYPESSIVVSCRTNFYELAEGAGSGLLAGFGLSHINGISYQDIVRTLNEQDQNGEAFYREAYDNGYQDLLTKPFFLNILAAVYAKEKSLQAGRAEVFREAIRLKIENAPVTSGGQPDDQEAIFRLLTRLALVMEFLGRNYLTDAEMEQTISESANRNLLENTFIVLRHKGNWSFEHNNIQEYFAANGMTGLRLEQVKALVAFYPDYLQVKPGWLNTLSFLISVAGEEQRKELLDWLIAIEPDALIKFEGERVDDATRFRVFSTIFEHFQINGLHVRSNKFTEAELGHFGDTPASLELLKSVIADVSKSLVNRLSALGLLDHFKLSPAEQAAVRQLILAFIYEVDENGEAVYATIHVLANLGLADAATVRILVDKFRERKEPYFRASLYVLLNKSGFTENYIDVFLEGVRIAGSRTETANRSSLWDETAQLKAGLLKMHQSAGIRTVLEFFREPHDPNYRYYSDKKEVLQSAVQRAANLYEQDVSLFDLILQLYVNYSKSGGTDYLKIFREFFERTETLFAAFKAVYQKDITSNFERELLLSFLIDEESAEFITEQFITGQLTEKALRSFHHSAEYHSRQSGHEDSVEAFTGLLLEKAQLTMHTGPDLERQRKRDQHEQDSFDLLFDEAGMKAGLERFWKEIGKEEVNFNQVWDFANQYEKDSDLYFPKSVTDVVADLLRDYQFGAVSAEDVKTFLTETPGFEDYRIEAIYGELKNRRPVKLSDAQLAIITEWVNRKVTERPIGKAIHPNGNIDTHVLIMWYFIKTLGIILPDEKLLEFTLFADYSQGDNEEPFRPIEKQAGLEATEKKVQNNLANGITIEQVWSNNAAYAISHSLSGIYEAIKNDLVRLNDMQSAGTVIAGKYLEATDDQEGLMEVFRQLGDQPMRWDLADLLKSGRLQTELVVALHAIQHSKEDPKEKIQAARRLTEMGSLEGFVYYANSILSKPRVADRHDGWFRHLNNLSDLAYLPKLMELLEYSLLPENTMDVFNRIDGAILDALFYLSLYSSENLEVVRSALQTKIDAHAPDWNYLLYMIEKMDFQYKVNRSREVSLDSAISTVSALGF
ncbi:hypothetical protein [Mucilaginibacter sp.]|uniref:NACHT domain-containing protein n=1 Tax=Mucilaginibacter sp. TaxID=1882438 RepID=UPI0025D3AFB7|nr:hypothetical protein [Mucilaginibacter sp.]